MMNELESPEREPRECWMESLKIWARMLKIKSLKELLDEDGQTNIVTS